MRQAVGLRMGSRQYTNREWKLLSYYLATYHPRAETFMNIRLGPTLPLSGIINPSAATDALSRVRNRWADALFIEGGLPTIVEAKIDSSPGIFSQLIHYARKFRQDPNWVAYRDKPLALVAVVYNLDWSVAEEAPFYGVRWVTFQPNFADWPLPVVKGTPFADSPMPLPQDWPQRLSVLLNSPNGFVY